VSPAELQQLIAAAAPGSRVTVVIVEVPDGASDGSAGGASDGSPTGTAVGVPRAGGVASVSVVRGVAAGTPPSAVPKPWTPSPGLAGLAPAIAERQTPYTCVELAELLQVKSETVSAWCRTQVLKDVPKIPGAGWRIPPASVLAMLAASTGGGSDGADAVLRTASASAAAVLSTPPAAVATSAARPARDDDRNGAADVPGHPATAEGDQGRDEPSPGDEAGEGHAVPQAVPEFIGGFDLAGLGSWRGRRAGGGR
jgi:hypothetical protein